jgi:hypothetical protein
MCHVMNSLHEDGMCTVVASHIAGLVLAKSAVAAGWDDAGVLLDDFQGMLAGFKPGWQPCWFEA